MSIEVHNGIATIDQSFGGKFIGATGGGKFPPIGHQYRLLTFEPKRGESGIVVFCDESMRESIGGADWLHLFQYEWSGDKLIVHWGIKHPVRAYTDSRELGLVVQARDWYYITGPVADRDHNYKVVDLFEMLKYIEGKIGLKELDHNARSYARRQAHVVRMKELEAEVKIKDLRIHEMIVLFHDKHTELRAAQGDVDNLEIGLVKIYHNLGWLDHIPSWMLPRGIKDLMLYRDSTSRRFPE